MGVVLKIYKPLDEKQYRFQHLGTKEPYYKFGWSQLLQNGGLVFITGGEKDVMTLAAHGYNAFTLNSETATLSADIVKELKQRFKKVIVLYDNDETGTKQAAKLVQEHQLLSITLPNMPKGKDISDFFALGNSLESFKTLIDSIQKISASNSLDPEKVFYSAAELIAMGNMNPKYLMQPIFPQKGTAVLAGKPDTGKSQFARQLCIQVALGLASFLDFPLTLTHKKAIYVATEDYLEATQYLLNKQLNGIGLAANDNLHFLFADTMEQHEILIKLEEELSKNSADLVVVDSFGDVFKGHDTNNNMAMRNTVKLFDKIANQYNCLILFVHHINKGAYRQAPGQEHIQGGAGLMQKVRLGIQLSEGEGSTRYFTVVKGNYCPKEYKQNSLELEFSESNFLFTNSGKLVPTNKIGVTNDDEKEEKYNELHSLAEEIFGEKLISYGKFVELYCNATGKSTPTAKRVHKQLKECEIIVSCNGNYRLTTPEERTLSDKEEIPI
jgi:hypothetical protein